MSVAQATIPLRHQQHIALDGISWELYEQLLRDVGNRPIRITYYRGSIEIMSPLPKHETWKKRIARMIELMALEVNIPMETLGSTTFRRRAKAVGLEPDECYYIQHAANIRGKDRLNLKVDPPPDLVVEIDITRRSIAREPIYARLGVPELWRYDGKRLAVLELTAGNKYRERESSLSFPFLPMAEFRKYLGQLGEADDLKVLRAFQKWVRTLAGK
jgi:Uma2 family endonuclease